MAACSVRALGAALALAGLAGCAAVTEVPRRILPDPDPARLMPVGSTWSVTAIAATALPADNGMLLRRESRRKVTGTTACNSFSARLGREGDKVVIDEFSITERACLGYSAQQEAALTGALLRVDGVAPGQGGGIVLTGEGAGLVALAPVPVPPPPRAARD